MNKRINKMLAMLCGGVVVLLIVLLVFANYRGDDGLTFTERKTLEKNGEAVVGEWVDEDSESEGFFDRLFGKDKDNTDKDADSDKDQTDDKDVTDDKDDEVKDDPAPVDPPVDDGKMTYEKYIAMSPEKQQAYFETFSSPQAFFTWFNNAKAEYEKNQDKTEVKGDGIDIGDYM